MKAYSDYRPITKSKTDVEVRVEGHTLRLFFDYEELTYKVKEGGKIVTKKQLRYESVDVEGVREYDNIVSAIIRDHYSDNEVQAILANYVEVNNTASVLALTPEKKEEYLQEYATFQQWRNHAKEVAQKVLQLI